MSARTVNQFVRPSQRNCLPAEAQTAFAHADKAAGADDQVIKDLNIEQLAGGDNLARDQHVVNIYMENHLTV